MTAALRPQESMLPQDPNVLPFEGLPAPNPLVIVLPVRTEAEVRDSRGVHDCWGLFQISRDTESVAEAGAWSTTGLGPVPRH